MCVTNFIFSQFFIYCKIMVSIIIIFLNSADLFKNKTVNTKY